MQHSEVGTNYKAIINKKREAVISDCLSVGTHIECGALADPYQGDLLVKDFIITGLVVLSSAKFTQVSFSLKFHSAI